MNKKITVSLILIISLIIIIFTNTKQNNIESINKETPSQEISKTKNISPNKNKPITQKEDLINQRINKVQSQKPTERPNLQGLVPENLEELRYEEEHGRLHKIEDQSYVNLDTKEVYLDYKHQIERFENEFVDQTLDFPLPNAMFEKEKTDPELFKELMENKPEWFDTENRDIVNYAFFQYIKPSELEMVAYDITNKKAKSFEFFYFEDGVNLRKTFFDSCNTTFCLNTENKIQIRMACGDKECRGAVAHENRDFFIIDEKGRIFIYNELDKEGNQIPFISGFIDED